MTSKSLSSWCARGLIVGLVVMRFALWWCEQHTVQACLSPSEVTLQLRIEQVLRDLPGARSLQVRVTDGPVLGCVSSIGQRLKLSYFGSQPLVGVKRFTASVRIKPLTGTHNPGLFRYDLWALSHGYLAFGYVQHISSTSPVSSVSAEAAWIGRELLLNEGILDALMRGDRSGITEDLWQLFRQTGTLHLMVISGLHVGIYAGISGFVCVWLLRLLVGTGLIGERFVSCLHLPTAAMLAGLAGAWSLVLVTGVQASVLRAAIMTSIGIGLLILRRSLTHSLQAWFGTACCVALLNPGYLLSQGYWLSFGAVLVIILFVAQEQPVHNRASQKLITIVRLFTRMQLVLFFCMAAWIGYATGYLSLLAPLANLIVVPLVTAVTMPLIVVAGLVEWTAGEYGIHSQVWRLADFSVWCVVEILHTMRETIPRGLLPVGYYDGLTMVLLTVASFVFLIPKPPMHQAIIFSLFTCTLLKAREEPVPVGYYRINVFDVGQGGGAMVTTARHRLLIDAGPAYRLRKVGDVAGFDSGESIIWPSVFRSGAPPVKRLVITHQDLDHAGGLGALRHHLPDIRIVADAEDCPHGYNWRWDNVQFTLLRDTTAKNDNDSSCTVLVRSKEHAAYFSGDISARAERQLLADLPRKVDFATSPHHGSGSSSSWQFVAHLQPRIVAHSAGPYNRYGHPREFVLARYAAFAGRNLVTSEVGAILWNSYRPGEVFLSRRGYIEID